MYKNIIIVWSCRMGDLENTSNGLREKGNARRLETLKAFMLSLLGMISKQGMTYVQKTCVFCG